MATGIVAVLLITRSRIGPKLVFNYPPNPIARLSQPATDHADLFDSDLESEADDEVSFSSQAINGSKGNDFQLNKQRSEAGSSQNDLDQSSRTEGTFLGYTVESLEKLLSPGPWTDKNKFEISIDSLTFIGHPLFANYEGKWGERYLERNAISRLDNGAVDSNGSGSMVQDDEPGQSVGISVSASEASLTATHDFTHISESLDSRLGQSLATSVNSTSTIGELAGDPITMFHLVFALQQRDLRVTRDMYEHVVKSLSKAVHYLQNRTSYVAVETRKLQNLRAKAKVEKWSSDTLLSLMLDGSELARALKEVYERISKGDIAGVRLGGMQMSLQIPAQMGYAKDREPLGAHTAILLLEEKDMMLRELGHPDASPLVNFIREHTPTKSLLKHAKNLSMPVNDVLYLARHLCTWRKARVIMPLHPRNFYVVHAEADLGRLPHLVAEYSRRFAGLPPLPQMLKMLGGRPMKYGLLIPSRDHRAPYMEILAYLVRHNFVVRLKTFAWLKTSTGGGHHTSTGDLGGARETEATTSLLSPQLRASEDDGVSVSSERTAIPLSGEGRNTSGPSNSLIIDSRDPSIEDDIALARIREAIADDELQEHFSKLIPYFDGEHPLEEIAACEDFKRAKVDMWLEALDRKGFIATFQCT